jgi:hypothetical protein
MSVKLTDNQRALLKEASRREDRCFVLPSNLKGGAAQKVAAKLIAEGLAREIKTKTGLPIWRRDGRSDQAYSLKLGAAGAKAVATSEERSGSQSRRLRHRRRFPIRWIRRKHPIIRRTQAKPRRGRAASSRR